MSEVTPKFTPGPWRHLKQFDHLANRSKSYVCYGEPDAVNPDDSTFPPDQCICGCGWSHWGENAANAALIAQSPAMYAELDDASAFLRIFADVLEETMKYDSRKEYAAAVLRVVVSMRKRADGIDALLRKAREEA